MSGIIMHCYDASPFTQKALRMLGLKQLEWRWVETPMAPPKDALVELTGGYRGTPVMQIGADIYIDSQLIAVELERRFPSPTLFPNGDRGLALMLDKWSTAFFRTGLSIAVEQTAASWPEGFLADRKFLFPDFDFDAARQGSDHARAQFRAHAGLLEAQLADGRDFLLGAAPGLADIQGHVFVWMARAYYPPLAAALLVDCPRLAAWEARVTALGEGRRSRIDSAVALAEAKSADRPVRPLAVAAIDPSGLTAGAAVEVTPDDTRRGAVRGSLAHLDRERIVIGREGTSCGSVRVHFPRLGYRVN